MNFAPIAECVKPIKKWSPRNSNEDMPFQYIDLSSVDRGSKSISQTSEMFPTEAPSRARQLVAANDVLVATVRPNLNGVAVVSEEYDGATASTGFCVLRPKERKLDHRYLFHWVKTPQFIQEMIKRSTGANYPAVSDKTVKSARIPLPPLAEQKRIAAILDKADDICRKRQEAIALADIFLRSVFLNMFGDPVTNPMGWDSGSLLDVVQNQREDLRCGPFGTQLKVGELVSSGVPLLGIENVLDDVFNKNYTNFITEEKAEQLNRFDVRAGDVLITRMGTIGRACVAPEEAEGGRISYHLFRVRVNPQRCIPEFLAATISKSGTFRHQLERLAHGAIMAGLSMEILKEVKFLIPPLGKQKEYLKIVQKHALVTASGNNLFKESKALFFSLQQRAFRGSL